MERRRGTKETLVMAATLGLLSVALGTACGGSGGGAGDDPDGKGGAPGTGGSGGAAPELAELEIVDGDKSIVEGDSVQFEARGYDSRGDLIELRSLTWRSTDSEVATIDDTGKATGHLPGEVEIVVAADGRTASARLRVEQAGVQRIVIVPEGPIRLMEGRRLTLEARAYDGAGRELGRDVEWRLAGEAASLEEGGAILAVKRGRATLTAVMGDAIAEIEVEVFRGFRELSLGHDFSCGIATNGEAWCWGDNSKGQLGANKGDPRSGIPLRVPSLTIRDLAAGATHTCAIEAGSHGRVACWGSNDSHQLGREDAAFSRSPGFTSWGMPELESLWAGKDFGCGLHEQGHAFCWGSNLNAYTLGLPLSVHKSSSPIAIAGPAAGDEPLVFEELALGDVSACGRTRDGKVYCWGSSGALGNNTGLPSQRPIEVKLDESAVRLAVGVEHACVLDSRGKTFCWGKPSLAGSTTPKEVDTGATSFQALALGAVHSCALDTDGRAFCWGSNTDGQLGREGGMSATPVEVAGGHRFIEIAARNRHTCGLTEDGKAFCWGNNDSGQLGDGSSTKSSTPVLVDTDFFD